MPEILFITDFSEACNKAAHYAAALAADTGCTLRILHAYIIPIMVSAPLIQPIPLTTMDEIKGVATTRMNELCSQLQVDFPTLSITQEIKYGEWEDAAYGEALSAATLIITAGDDDDGFWLGNDMHHAALDFQKPVLVVPGQALYSPLQKICLACDAASMTNMQPVISILPLLKSSGASLELLHIHASDSDAAKWENASLATALAEIPYSLFEQKAAADAVDKKIHDFAVSSGAQWLALIPHHYSFFQGFFHKSHTKAAFRMGDFPVLCLH